MSFFDTEDFPGRKEAEGLGFILGHGLRNVQYAINACREGKATPQQQKIVVGLLEILAKK